MSDVLKRQLAELKRRVAELEGQLATPNAAMSEGEESEQLARAEKLFSVLLEAKPVNLVSYSRAYKEVIGDYEEWRNAVHAPEIIRIARRTKPRSASSLTIRLDSLIVGKTTGSPAAGHFKSSDYGQAIWQQTFGGHPVLC